ncbi:hypothetical protein [unidentified bacterial endosymbiont]|nr:hypothetical protein [unidentified bacterial endosymbiont]
MMPGPFFFAFFFTFP